MQHIVRRRLAHLSYAISRAFIGIADALSAPDRPKPVQLSSNIEGFAFRVTLLANQEAYVRLPATQALRLIGVTPPLGQSPERPAINSGEPDAPNAL